MFEEWYLGILLCYVLDVAFCHSISFCPPNQNGAHGERYIDDLSQSNVLLTVHNTIEYHFNKTYIGRESWPIVKRSRSQALSSCLCNFWQSCIISDKTNLLPITVFITHNISILIYAKISDQVLVRPCLVVFVIFDSLALFLIKQIYCP